VPLDPLKSGPLDTFLILSSGSLPSEAVQRVPHIVFANGNARILARRLPVQMGFLADLHCRRCWRPRHFDAYSTIGSVCTGPPGNVILT
jgi:hypothetical protein